MRAIDSARSERGLQELVVGAHLAHDAEAQRLGGVRRTRPVRHRSRATAGLSAARAAA